MILLQRRASYDLTSWMNRAARIRCGSVCEVACATHAGGGIRSRSPGSRGVRLCERVKKSRDLLRASQRQWVAFREAEHAALGGPWREDRGTIIRVLTMSADLSAIKERVQELRLDGPDGS